MDTPQTNEITVKLAREVVSQMASDELDGFDDTAKDFLRDPRQVRRAVKEREKEGAFGGGELVIITPIALAVSSEVVRFLMEPVKTGLDELFKSFFAELFKKFFKDTAPPSSDTKLTPEQLQAAYKRGMDVAEELGLNHDRAALMMDAVIAHLAIAIPNQQVNSTNSKE